MKPFPIFQKRPKLWAAVVCCLASFEVYVLSALLFRGEFLPLFLTERANELAVIPTAIVCSAFGYFVYLALKLPVNDAAMFQGASLQEKHRLVISLRILGAYFACLFGMCATLFFCATNGPWRKLLEGISGPNAGLPDYMWPVIFFAVIGGTLLVVERIVQDLLGGGKNGISRHSSS